MLHRLFRALTLVVACALCALPAAAVAPQEVAVPATSAPTVYRAPDGHAAAGGWSGPLVAGAAPEPNRPMMEMAPARGASSQATVAPCAIGDCSAATSIACNSALPVTSTTDQWDSYSCLDTSLIPSLPYSESLLKHTVATASQDIGLSVPLVTTEALGDWFGAILNTCNNSDCTSASHTTDLVAWQDAMVSNAPLQEFQMVAESPNTDNFAGDVIFSCGTHNPGWCESRVRQTLDSGTFNVIHDTTATGNCDVIQYEDWPYAFDGNEVVYRLPLTRSTFVSVTLEYAGNAGIPYKNYMAAFVLTGDCDQQDYWMYTYLVGESGYTWTWVWDILPAGIYYIVVDGSRMPCSGDNYTLIVTTQTQEMWMPVVRQPHRT